MFSFTNISLTDLHAYPKRVVHQVDPANNAAVLLPTDKRLLRNGGAISGVELQYKQESLLSKSRGIS